MSDNKRPTQTKYLAVNDYLQYKKIEKENWFFSDEMNKFLKEHDLPMISDSIFFHFYFTFIVNLLYIFYIKSSCFLFLW